MELSTARFPCSGKVAVAIGDNVLGLDFVDNILMFCRSNRHLFAPSTVLGDQVIDHRRSWTTRELGGLGSVIRTLVLRNFENICGSLGMPAFQIADIDVQVTFHKDGDYYRPHRDNSGIVTKSRKISYVYYFSAKPSGFEGGRLRLYAGSLDEIESVSSLTTVDVEAINNRFVAFDSSLVHEVLPVRTSETDFVDGRGSLVGWIRSFEGLAAGLGER